MEKHLVNSCTAILAASSRIQGRKCFYQQQATQAWQRWAARLSWSVRGIKKFRYQYDMADCDML
jgi:hypothetical protein